jgi:acetylornithine deacetylase/succinyl-diaminopimelate desuccinylase-like protein
MVRIPSPTLEEGRLALFLARYMKQVGLEVELQAVPLPDDRVGVQPVGRWRGAGGGHSLLLSGHMDYIGETMNKAPAPTERWRYAPFSGTLDDGYVYGRGSKDDKGGICAAISAAEALVRSGLRLRGDLIVAPVMGHKTSRVGGGIGARHLMASGLRTDAAIVAENTNLGIASQLVGRVSARLTMTGMPAWFDDPGSDLFGRLARLLDRLGPNFGTVKQGGWLTFREDPTMVGFPMVHYEGIEIDNGACRLALNVRIVPGQTDASVKADLERLLRDLAGSDPHVGVEVDILQPVRYPHGIPVDDPLITALARAHRAVRGVAPEIGLGPARGAVADSWFFIESGLTRTTVYGPGTLEPDFHDLPDERIAVRDVIDCSRVFALTAIEVCEVA